MRYLVTDIRKQGLGHISKNIPCQDYTYVESKNGYTTIALADGAGSCANSHYGACAVSKRIAKIMSKNFDEFYSSEDPTNVVKIILDDLLSTLNDVAKERNCDVMSLSSTLQFATIHDGKMIIGQVGDGTIGAKKYSELKIISQENKGGAINETFFVTTKEAYSLTKLYKGSIKGFEMLALMSDGSEASLVDKNDFKNRHLVKGFNTFIDWIRYYSDEQVLAAFDKTFDAVIKKTRDDCSLSMLVIDWATIDTFGKPVLHRILSKYVKNTSKYLYVLTQLENKLITPCDFKYLKQGLNKKMVSKVIKYLMKEGLVCESQKKYQLA